MSKGHTAIIVDLAVDDHGICTWVITSSDPTGQLEFVSNGEAKISVGRPLLPPSVRHHVEQAIVRAVATAHAEAHGWRY